MTTKLKRTAITIDPSTDALLAKLSSLQRRPKARIITDLLRDVEPALRHLVDLLEAAGKNRERLPKDAAYRLEAIADLLTEVGQISMDKATAACAPATPRSGPRGRVKARH